MQWRKRKEWGKAKRQKEREEGENEKGEGNEKENSKVREDIARDTKKHEDIFVKSFPRS